MPERAGSSTPPIVQQGRSGTAADAQLRAVQDTSTVWLWEQDAEFRFTLDLRGRDHAEPGDSVIGMRRWDSPDFVVPLQGTWDDHRRVLEAHLPFRDFEFRIGDGADARYVSTTGVPVFHPDGSFAGYRGTAMDVTQLKNSQREIERSQSLLRLASRLGRVAAWSIELPELRTLPSPEFLRLLRFPDGAAPSVRDVLALVRRRQQPELYRAWMACVESGTPFDLEVRVFPVEGPPMWLRLVGEAVRRREGRTTCIEGAAQDITASKEDRERLRALGEQLAASNAELSERVRERTQELETVNTELKGFAHALAHDLKAPIAAIAGFGAALGEALAAGDLARATHFGARMRSAGLRLGEYVDALLSMAEASQSVMRLDQVDLSALAHRVLDELQGRDPERQVQRTIEPGLVVQGDRRLLAMLLENLLGNAWKFTARRPLAHIRLGQREAGGETVYFVQDDGAGFEMEWADRLFGNFQRLHSAGEFPGTGIGLANAQRVVTRHGGRIWAEGRVGEGATFSFTLPGAHPPRGPSSSAQTSAPTATRAR